MSETAIDDGSSQCFDEVEVGAVAQIKHGRVKVAVVDRVCQVIARNGLRNVGVAVDVDDERLFTFPFVFGFTDVKGDAEIVDKDDGDHTR